MNSLLISILSVTMMLTLFVILYILEVRSGK